MNYTEGRRKSDICSRGKVRAELSCTYCACCFSLPSVFSLFVGVRVCMRARACGCLCMRVNLFSKGGGELQVLVRKSHCISFSPPSLPSPFFLSRYLQITIGYQQNGLASRRPPPPSLPPSHSPGCGLARKAHSLFPLRCWHLAYYTLYLACSTLFFALQQFT